LHGYCIKVAHQNHGKIFNSLFTRLVRLFPDGRLDYTKKAYLPLVSQTQQ
jgi:hypothetical protein